MGAIIANKNHSSDHICIVDRYYHYGEDQRYTAIDIRTNTPRMSSRLSVESSRKYPSSSFNLTVEEVFRLTTQVLAELSQGQKPDIQEEGKQNGAGDAWDWIYKTYIQAKPTNGLLLFKKVKCK